MPRHRLSLWALVCVLAASGASPRGQSSPATALADVASWRGRVTMVVNFAARYLHKYTPSL